MQHNAESRVCIDAKMKDKAEKLFKRYGLPLNIGVKMLIEHAIQTKRVPYHPHAPNAETRATLEEARNSECTVTTLDELQQIWNDTTLKTSKKRGQKNAK